MNETLLGYVQRKLDEARGTWPEVSRKTKVPIASIYKLGQRVLKDPRVGNLEKLAKYFRAKDAARARGRSKMRNLPAATPQE